jgi:hypothetical protein
VFTSSTSEAVAWTSEYLSSSGFIFTGTPRVKTRACRGRGGVYGNGNEMGSWRHFMPCPQKGRMGAFEIFWALVGELKI